MTEHIKVTCHGDNDYSVYFDVADFSVRGTYDDVMQAIYEHAVADMLRNNRRE